MRDRFVPWTFSSLGIFAPDLATRDDADDLLGVLTVGGGGCGGGKGAGDEEGAGEVADGGDYYREVIPAVPEAVVGGLVAEDQRRGFQIAEEGKRGMERRGVDERA